MKNPKGVSQTPHPALVLISSHPALFMRQGAVVPTWRRDAHRRRGPYYCLIYRHSARQRWVYLGREGPLVQQVRQLLADVQRPYRHQRAFRRIRNQVAASLRLHRGDLDHRLRALGLRLHGFQTRGWRSSPQGSLRAARRSTILKGGPFPPSAP